MTGSEYSIRTTKEGVVAMEIIPIGEKLQIKHSTIVRTMNGDVKTMHDLSSNTFCKLYLNGNISAPTRETSLQITDTYLKWNLQLRTLLNISTTTVVSLMLAGLREE